MNLQKYIAFAMVCEHSSFSKAAEVLNYSQSGVSRMINDLEKEWGVVLFNRSKTGVKLTSDGEKILPYIIQICNDYSNLKEQLDEIKNINKGSIKIGVFSSVATHLLPNVIGEFQKLYPNIDYELLMGDYKEIETWVTEGRVDFGFTRYSPNLDLESYFIKKDEMMVVLPKSNKYANADYFPADAIKDYPFMLLDKGSNNEILEILLSNNVQPNIKFTTWDDYAIMSMVESGLGISILPNLILTRIPYDIAIKKLDIDAERDICIIIKDKNSISISSKKFLKFMNVIK